jgi:hypothetical protein
MHKWQREDSAINQDRSVWSNTTPEMITDVYGEKFHPFAEKGKFSESKLHTCATLLLQLLPQNKLIPS